MEFFGGDEWREISSQQGIFQWENYCSVSRVRMEKSLWKDEWVEMMNILAQIDVSAITHMEIQLPRYSWDDGNVSDSETMRGFGDVYGMDHLGPLLGSRRFAQLISLRITIPRSGRVPRNSDGEEFNSDAVFGLNVSGSAHLARALESGKFTVLSELFLPACADVPEILGALKTGHISRLESFSILSTKVCSQSTLRQILNAVSEPLCFKRSNYLRLSNMFPDGIYALDDLLRTSCSAKMPLYISFNMDSGPSGIHLSTNSPWKITEQGPPLTYPVLHFGINKCLSDAEWLIMMGILAQIDVSKIRYMELELPACTWDNPRVESCNSVFESVYGMDYLGPLLGSGRFMGLASLRITITRSGRFGVGRNSGALPSDQIQIEDNAVFGLNLSGTAHLARALKSGQFKNLLDLSLPACTDVPEILRALEIGHISKLSSFCITSTKCDNLDALLEAGRFKSLRHLQSSNGILDGMHEFPSPTLVTLSLPACRVPKILGALRAGPISRLQHLELCNGVLDGVDGWEALIRAIKSGKVPNVTSLRLSQNALNRVNLADLLPLLLATFLEILIIDGCWLNSKQLWGLADALMNGSNTGLALKHLDFSNNLLGAGSDILLRDSGVDALVELANSNLLPQLKRLDLSMNDGRPEAFIRLMNSVEMRHLPNLESVKWRGNRVSNEAGEVMSRAYTENEDITTDFDIDWNQVKNPSLRIKADEYKQRNIRISALKKQHKELQEDPVGLTSAKVFFGGWQEVGKTTLRTALCGNSTFKKHTWSRKLKRPIVPRTRGIELSQIEQAGVTLTLWDLAGQEDYHVLHGTFFPDLGLTHGRATTFVLVFRADLEGDVKKDLLYWLRFAASSSQKFVKRHVVIVLNCFEGKLCAENDKVLFKGWLKKYQGVFEDFLDIHTDPFEMDVRDPIKVQPLKTHLFERAEILLEKVTVPKVCLELQNKLNGWSQGDINSHLPIMTWQAFEARMGRPTSGKDFKAAALYLHEIGWIIYFDHKEKSVVVLDPSWLCSKVVGELLLPANLLEELKQKKGASDGIQRQVERDGSMDTCIFEAFLEGKLVEGTTSDDVISVLERLGVCFRKGRKMTSKLFFPALNQEDNYVRTAWGRQRSGGQVVGRRLAIEENHWSAIPVTVFRHLQVELSKDLNLGGSDDSEYIGGKAFSTFKVGAILVLIEFNVDHLDPANDRIDILVKNTAPSQDSMNPTVEQVGLICQMMEKVQKVCCTYCPGLNYDIKVIQPWSALDDIPEMSRRGIMALQEIKGFLMEDQPYRGPYLSWQVKGKQVKMESCLSDSELELVLKLKTEMKRTSEVKRRTDVVREDSDVLIWEAIQQIEEEHFWADMSSGAVEENEEPDVASELSADIEDDIPPKSASEIEHDSSGLLAGEPLQDVEEDRSSALSRFTERAPVEDQNSGHQGVTNGILQVDIREILQAEMQSVLQRIEELHTDTRQQLDESTKQVFMIAEKLLFKVEAQYSFSIQEQEKSVPRYVLLREKHASGVWSHFQKGIKKPFQKDFLLHFLCESQFDGGSLHWVKDQNGLQLSKTSAVSEKLSEAEPWVRWSLYVAAFLGKVTLNILSPPSGNLIPIVSTTSTMEQDKIGKTGVKMLQNDEEIYLGNSGTNEELLGERARLIAQGDLGTDELLTDVKMRLMAEGVVHALMKEKGMHEFLKGTRLRRVLIKGFVKWICVDCLKQYGVERVTDITPRH